MVIGHAESPAGAQWWNHFWGCARDGHGPALSNVCHTHSHALAAWSKAKEATASARDQYTLALPGAGGTHEKCAAYVRPDHRRA